MKKYLASSLMLGLFLLVLIGMPLQSAYAMGPKGGYDKDKFDVDNKDCKTTKVPEPATLALLGSGIAGVGLYGFMKRKNRK